METSGNHQAYIAGPEKKPGILACPQILALKFFWAGACARLSVVARSCVCVSGVGQRTRHTAVPAPTKVGSSWWLAFERARSLSVADQSGGWLVVGFSARAPKGCVSCFCSGGESWVFILLADFCREPSRLNFLKKNFFGWRGERGEGVGWN